MQVRFADTNTSDVFGVTGDLEDSVGAALTDISGEEVSDDDVSLVSVEQDGNGTFSICTDHVHLILTHCVC